jgi:hypothetical protein
MWAAPSSPSPDPTSRKAITDECRPSRRQQFRQFVIVDGATVSPDPPPKELPDTEEHGVLHRIIPLFFGSVTEGQVEEALISMIEIEVKRVTARAGEFDAQAKARLVWLLEEVAKDVS